MVRPTEVSRVRVAIDPKAPDGIQAEYRFSFDRDLWCWAMLSVRIADALDRKARGVPLEPDDEILLVRGAEMVDQINEEIVGLFDRVT